MLQDQARLLLLLGPDQGKNDDSCIAIYMKQIVNYDDMHSTLSRFVGALNLNASMLYGTARLGRVCHKSCSYGLCSVCRSERLFHLSCDRLDDSMLQSQLANTETSATLLI